MKDRVAESRLFSRRVLIAAGTVIILAIVLFLLHYLVHVLLILFAGVLLAVFLDGVADYLSVKTRMPRGLALVVVALLIAGFLFALGWLAGPRVVQQFTLLTTRMPEAVNSVKSILMERAWGRDLLAKLSSAGQILPLGIELIGGITGVFKIALGLVTGAVIVLFVGIYLAVNPSVYIDNAIRLLPAAKHQRAREVVRSVGQALHWWLIGRFTSMALVGIFTAIGLFVTGVPLALTLAIIAALASFVPYLGAILSAVPAIVVALAENPIKVISVVIVYLGVHFLEGYFITPLIQRRAVSIPPALLLTVQIVMGVLVGTIGILLATPLAVAAIVVIQMIYVEDVLGGSVRVLGKHERSP